MESILKYSSSADRDQPISGMTASTGRRPAALAGTHGQSSAHMESHHESTYHCSRAGRAVCQPDLRSDRQQSDLRRLRLGTKLPLLWFQSITPLGEDFPFKPTRWLDYAAGPVPAAWSKIRARCEGRMLGKVRISATASPSISSAVAVYGRLLRRPHLQECTSCRKTRCSTKYGSH